MVIGGNPHVSCEEVWYASRMKSIQLTDDQVFELNRLCANEIQALREQHAAAGSDEEREECDILIIDLMATQSQLAG